MTPLEAFVASLAEAALLRIYRAIDERAAIDLRVIHAMAVVRSRGVRGVFNHAARQIRAQQGAMK
jgi:hypothetical protein